MEETKTAKVNIRSCRNCRQQGHCIYDDGMDACVYWEKIPCPDCGGTLSEIQTNGEKPYRHCYSCHFEYEVNDHGELRTRIQTDAATEQE